MAGGGLRVRRWEGELIREAEEEEYYERKRTRVEEKRSRIKGNMGLMRNNTIKEGIKQIVSDLDDIVKEEEEIQEVKVEKNKIKKL